MLRLILGDCPPASRKDQYHILSFMSAVMKSMPDCSWSKQKSLLWGTFTLEELVDSPLLQASSVASQQHIVSELGRLSLLGHAAGAPRSLLYYITTIIAYK